ncbi:MAG: adenine deaminase [Bacteroidetes bacterium]|nr:MAG: adenine deaminase [Bacteroidota bacterium]
MQHIVKGNLVNISLQTIIPSAITIVDGIIQKIETLPKGDGLPFIVPGFIDAHVHIESSLLVPSEFARLAVQHGTIATISDPHEIANVCGVEGVRFMVENGKASGFNFFFGVPSCVPATAFETAGASIQPADVAALLQSDDMYYLAEMMNFPGVWHKDADVMQKLQAAITAGKPIDGHAPGLRGQAMKQYFYANETNASQPIISTDHECFSYEEALEKLQAGVKIIIREGSAAKNFEVLISLLPDWSHQIMFCSDDKHPDSFDNGHINQLCARAVALGYPLFAVLQAACINPILHYRLPIPPIAENELANFCVVNNFLQFCVIQTFIKGNCVFTKGEVLLPVIQVGAINRFAIEPIKPVDIEFSKDDIIINDAAETPAIKAIDSQLITEKHWLKPIWNNDAWHANLANDCIKLVVVNRYSKAPVAKAFIHGTGIKTGAMASSVAHDSHNIIAMGVEDDCLLNAINTLIAHKGGLAVATKQETQVLALPVAGLMSNQPAETVTELYKTLDLLSKQQLGSTLQSPFMTLSFMALLVIPALKLSDKGLFDGAYFTFVKTVSV